MAKKHKTSQAQISSAELDSVYLLKLVLYVILGTQWLWLEQSSGSRLPVPLGLVIGIIFASHDHFQIDRKVEYAVLLVAMLLGFVLNIGIVVTL